MKLRKVLKVKPNSIDRQPFELTGSLIGLEPFGNIKITVIFKKDSEIHENFRVSLEGLMRNVHFLFVVSVNNVELFLKLIFIFTELI